MASRLIEWDRRWPGRASILYWVGHGFQGSDAALLAHHLTVHSDDWAYLEGVLPIQIGRLLSKRDSNQPRPPWTVVLIEACASAVFVQQLSTYLTGLNEAPEEILLFGTSPGGGETRLGELSRQLDHTLRTHSPPPARPSR